MSAIVGSLCCPDSHPVSLLSWDRKAHLDCGDGEVARRVGGDRLEAAVGLRLETVAHRKHLAIIDDDGHEADDNHQC